MTARLNGMLRPALALVCLAVFAAAPGCPPPSGPARLSLLVTRGEAPPDSTKGGELAAGEILGLVVRVDRVLLLGAPGTPDLVLRDQALTLDLVEYGLASELEASVTPPEGEFLGAEITVGSAVLIPSADPGHPVPLAVPGEGVFEVDSPFFTHPDSPVMLVLDFGGAPVMPLEGGGYAFEPALALSLRGHTSEVRVTGNVTAIDLAGRAFVLGADASEHPVEFSGASIFIPGDRLAARGTPDHLREGDRVAVRGLYRLDGSMAGDWVEILDFADTAADEAGDRIAICHAHGGEAEPSHTVTVGRIILEEHLAHGDRFGACMPVGVRVKR